MSPLRQAPGPQRPDLWLGAAVVVTCELDINGGGPRG